MRNTIQAWDTTAFGTEGEKEPPIFHYQHELHVRPPASTLRTATSVDSATNRADE
uniref:Uncharacterized protein n=1 Tax=Arundo donax TaxID=35708 RepID=A0A0A9HDU9_ARUDO